MENVQINVQKEWFFKAENVSHVEINSAENVVLMIQQTVSFAILIDSYIKENVYTNVTKDSSLNQMFVILAVLDVLNAKMLKPALNVIPLTPCMKILVSNLAPLELFKLETLVLNVIQVVKPATIITLTYVLAAPLLINYIKENAYLNVLKEHLLTDLANVLLAKLINAEDVLVD